METIMLKNSFGTFDIKSNFLAMISHVSQVLGKLHWNVDMYALYVR